MCISISQSNNTREGPWLQESSQLEIFFFSFMLADLATGIQEEPEEKKYRGALLL
jgi:hypothetical protein